VRSWRASLQRTLSIGCLATSEHLAVIAAGLRCAALTLSCLAMVTSIVCSSISITRIVSCMRVSKLSHTVGRATNMGSTVHIMHDSVRHAT
jgi:hypothetical protein